MIRHVFSVACQVASVDQLSNSLSLFNVLESVTAQAPSQPLISDPPVGLPIESSVVSVWFNDGLQDEEATQRISLVTPDARVLKAHDASMIVKAGQSHRMLAKMPAIPYFGDGRYWIEVSVLKGKAWECIARLPFSIHVTVVSEPQVLVQ